MEIPPLGNVALPGSTAPSASNSAATAPAASSISTGTTPAVATPAATSSATQPDPSAAQVNHAVQKINTAMSAQSQGIEFSIDSSSHRIVVNIVDQNTNQVIRQIPSKEALAIADSLDQTQGLLIKQQA
jgi:flagellar protein FlaG